MGFIGEVISESWFASYFSHLSFQEEYSRRRSEIEGISSRPTAPQAPSVTESRTYFTDDISKFLLSDLLLICHSEFKNVMPPPPPQKRRTVPTDPLSAAAPAPVPPETAAQISAPTVQFDPRVGVLRLVTVACD